MTRFLLLVTALASGAVAVRAQSPGGFVSGQTLTAAELNAALSAKQDYPTPAGGDISANVVTATGGNNARTMAARAADVVNVRDQAGVVCDGNTNSTAGINAAVAIIRAAQKGRLDFAGCNVRVNSTLNFTGLANRSITIEGGGSQILCATSATPCIDALGSVFTRWRDMSLLGASTPALSPSYGIQIGRINNTASDSGGQGMTFENFNTAGNFSGAAMYNFSGEVVKFDHVNLLNGYVGASCYGIIQDGLNHFNVTSAFVTENAPTDTQQSFNENTFVNSQVLATGGCTPIWLGGTRHHKWIDSYGQNTQAGYEVVLWTDGTAVMDLDMDVHFETNPTDIFFVTGPVTAPVFNGIRYRDHWSFASNSIFKLDTPITAVTVHGLELTIAKFQGSVGVHAFDNPTPWTVDANSTIWLPAAANWNAVSTQFTGWTNLAGVVAISTSSMFIGNGPQGALGANSFVFGTQHGASGQGDFAAGQHNTLSGNFSTGLGENAGDRGRFGTFCSANGRFSADGDAQGCATVLRGTTTGGAAVRLTGSGGAAGATNCGNIPNNSAFNMRVALHARDATTAGTDYDWYLPTGMITRDATAATTAVSLGTPVILSRGTVTGASVSLTADTTNGCPNLTFTPPNNDTWRSSARLETTEVQ